jgi:hypothetical protein
MDLRNVGILPHHYTASRPRKPRLEPLFYARQGTSTSKVIGYELDDRRSTPTTASTLSLMVHRASHPIGTDGPFPRNRAAGTPSNARFRIRASLPPNGHRRKGRGLDCVVLRHRDSFAFYLPNANARCW